MSNKKLLLMKQWKLGIHLIFQTKRFGVNNLWFSNNDSIFGIGFFHRILKILLIYPLTINYRNLKWRMGTTVGFVSQAEYKEYFKHEHI